MSFPFCWHSYKQLIFTPFLAGTSPTVPTKIMDSNMLRFWDGALASTVRTLHPWLPAYRLICVNHFSLQDISRRWICSRKQILFPKLVLWWVMYLFFLVDNSILMQYLCDLLWCYGPIWASIVFSRSLYIYIYIYLRRLSGLSQNPKVPSRCFDSGPVGLEEMLAPTPTPVACFPQHLGKPTGFGEYRSDQCAKSRRRNHSIRSLPNG